MLAETTEWGNEPVGMLRDAARARQMMSPHLRATIGETRYMPEQISVADIAVLFTDLKGSSALYRRFGDAAAYRLIRGHFDLLAAIIADCQGVLVKTIGDAVMAVFATCHMAVKAALAIQAQVNVPGPGEPAGTGSAGTGLTVKLGIHAGSAIAVRLQDRCDYFGEVVNMAAQLRDLSRGGEIVVSQAVAEDPLLRPLLAGYKLAAERIALKGSADIQPVARISRCVKISALTPSDQRPK